MEGVANAFQAGAAAALVWQYQTRGFLSRNTRDRPTKQQIRETVSSDPRIGQSIRAIPRKGAGQVGGISVLAFCHWLFSQRGRREADEFIRQLMVGDHLAENDPVFRCRQRLILDKKMSINDKAELIMRAWNHRKNRREVTKLQLSGVLPGLEG